jgi:hypothetical protein
MPHMIPVVEETTMFVVETENGTELVPADVVGRGPLNDYIEGSRIFCVRKQSGFFSRLTAPGHLDRTDWTGPFDSFGAAMLAQCELHDIDTEGYSLDENGDRID